MRRCSPRGACSCLARVPRPSRVLACCSMSDLGERVVFGAESERGFRGPRSYGVRARGDERAEPRRRPGRRDRFFSGATGRLRCRLAGRRVGTHDDRCGPRSSSRMGRERSGVRARGTSARSPGEGVVVRTGSLSGATDRLRRFSRGQPCIGPGMGGGAYRMVDGGRRSRPPSANDARHPPCPARCEVASAISNSRLSPACRTSPRTPA